MQRGIGLALSQDFYDEIVAPTLQRGFPALRYAAARVGIGSEVLGFDTALSADHDYGPCVQIFLQEADFRQHAPAIMAALDAAVPDRFKGWMTRYPTATRAPREEATMMLGSDHGAELYTLPAWCDRFFGRQFDGDLSALDWLSYAEQMFLTATAGAVFRDDIGDLTALRSRLAWFPRDVWLYKLAAQWGRIAEERAYVGRAGDVGDEIGSRVITARMVGNLMRLAMLIERCYAPYPKWFGSAFARLGCAPQLEPMLTAVLVADDWRTRESRLADACRFVANLQVDLGVPGAVAPEEGRLHDRPYRFVDTLRIGDSIQAEIGDAWLKGLPGFGGADQILGNFALAVPDWSKAAMLGLVGSQ